ncbi:MAG: hypothetical protein WD872_15445 [Pirellulaceae bacterium]
MAEGTRQLDNCLSKLAIRIGKLGRTRSPGHRPVSIHESLKHGQALSTRCTQVNRWDVLVIQNAQLLQRCGKGIDNSRSASAPHSPRRCADSPGIRMLATTATDGITRAANELDHFCISTRKSRVACIAIAEPGAKDIRIDREL